MWDLGVDNGITAVGFSSDDIPALVKGTLPQVSIYITDQISNHPCDQWLKLNSFADPIGFEFWHHFDFKPVSKSWNHAAASTKRCTTRTDLANGRLHADSKGGKKEYNFVVKNVV